MRYFLLVGLLTGMCLGQEYCIEMNSGKTDKMTLGPCRFDRPSQYSFVVDNFVKRFVESPNIFSKQVNFDTNCCPGIGDCLCEQFGSTCDQKHPENDEGCKIYDPSGHSLITLDFLDPKSENYGSNEVRSIIDESHLWTEVDDSAEIQQLVTKIIGCCYGVGDCLCYFEQFGTCDSNLLADEACKPFIGYKGKPWSPPKIFSFSVAEKGIHVELSNDGVLTVKLGTGITEIRIDQSKPDKWPPTEPDK